MPQEVLALYSRWWQLETYLRSLLYVELRASHGVEWINHIGQGATHRREQDKARRYMATADWEDPLSYLDVSKLFPLLEANWDLVEPSLMDKDVLFSRVPELTSIRNRLGHLRRPHPDDLNRLEQTLRDLEGGAFTAYSTYNEDRVADSKLDDPVVAAWGRGEHETAQRLINHARDQYEVNFHLSYSLRPSGQRPTRGAPVTGTRGAIWKATFLLLSRDVKIPALWRDSYLNRNARELLIHMLVDFGSISFTFPAIDDGKRVSDAIGEAFDAILLNSHRGSPGRMPTEREVSETAMRSIHLDPRIQTGSGWNIVDETTVPVRIFGAH
ncbi:Swt1 family HEPN domain-containing protein [Streptomyces sp. NPDC005805]|uniref:Swt1 family HEPN domain-containing protein n=1 Tax=Streptomyces sp. NPDC005805 TaxID=3157068 RepID=UPI0033CFBD6C